MLARVGSACLSGIEAALVPVEVDVAAGLPAFTMVGLPDSTVRESRDRIRSAIRNAGFTFPMEHITVSLAPADLRREGVPGPLFVAGNGREAARERQGRFASPEDLRRVPGIGPKKFEAIRELVAGCE